MSGAVDDIVFAIGKATAKSGDNVVKAGAKAAGAAAANAVKKFDPSSLMKNMSPGSYFKNLKLPDVPLKTSNLFHTTDALKGLKKVGIKDLVPKSTSDLLTSLSKSVDDIPTSSVDDIANSLKKVDLNDATAVASVAKNSSLSKLKDISQQLSKKTAKNADLAGKKASDGSKLVDDALQGGKFKNADEMTDAMKNSSGISKKADDIADTSADVAKKADLGKLDEAADAAKQAKKSKVMKALDFAKKHEGKLSIGLVGAFMLAEHVNRSVPSGATGPEDFVYDPGEVDAGAAIQEAEAEISSELITLDESEDSVLTSNPALLGVMALGAAAFAF